MRKCKLGRSGYFLYEFDHSLTANKAGSADFTRSEDRIISTDVLLPPVDTLYIRLQRSLHDPSTIDEAVNKLQEAHKKLMVEGLQDDEVGRCIKSAIDTLKHKEEVQIDNKLIFIQIEKNLRLYLMANKREWAIPIITGVYPWDNVLLSTLYVRKKARTQGNPDSADMLGVRMVDDKPLETFFLSDVKLVDADVSEKETALYGKFASIPRDIRKRLD